MNITWFAPNNKNADSIEPQILLSHHPKGIKMNKILMEKVKEMNIGCVKVGLSGSLLVIKETSQHDFSSFNITNFSKNGANIRSVSIHQWADEQKLLKKRVSGTWNETEQQFEFNLLNAK